MAGACGAHAGMGSRFAAPARFSYLERTTWELDKYVVNKLRAADPALDPAGRQPGIPTTVMVCAALSGPAGRKGAQRIAVRAEAPGGVGPAFCAVGVAPPPGVAEPRTLCTHRGSTPNPCWRAPRASA